jgi:c-di-GMP-binding flagellar brake protein YcgR
MLPTAQYAAKSGRFNDDLAGSRLLWSRHQIVHLLQRFIHEDHPVSVHYADEKRVIVTRALQLDRQLNRIYFEYGDHKGANSRLLRSKEVQFSVAHGADSTQFTSPRARDVLLAGRPVFQVPIPARVIQADRRLHRRITVPQISAPVVTFSLPGGRQVKGRLADMSATGIGVIGFAADEKVRTGTEVQDCVIQLDDGKQMVVDLKIRHAALLKGANGKPTHRIGFRLASRPKDFSDLLKAFTVDL